MLSLRAIARQVPRSTGRIASTASLCTRQSVWRQAARKPATSLRLGNAFSTSRPRFSGNEELAEKLHSEIQIEKEHQEDGSRSTVDEYLQSSEYTLEDVEGQEEVALTRQYGDEQIRVVFSIADFSQEMEADETEDPAMYADEAEMEGQSGGANTKGSVNQGRTKGGNMQVSPDEDIAPGDRDELRSDDEVQEPGFPARAQVHVTKPGKGALTIECTVRDGEVVIEELFYFSKEDMAEPKSAEQDYARRSLYTGPPFSQLDEDLQTLLDRYIDERGINTAMALFIPDYIDHKEQKEYIRWLENMKSFVD